ncbi:uncharacterized protein J3R85_015870 [Psidium guajava]|nr:uncharacterized protein J3R85_015870 [Psidium guajava]
MTDTMPMPSPPWISTKLGLSLYSHSRKGKVTCLF